MGDELICPDCGGVIGATEITDAGRPCKCFVGRLQPSVATAPAPSESAPAEPENQPAKLCFKCGKDVSGQKRVKDNRGYLCYGCAKEEREAERGGRIRCATCSRWAAPQAITEYEGMKICDKCLHERQEVAKKSFKKLGITTTRVRHEKKQVYRLLTIAGVLLLIIVLRKMGMLPGMMGK